MKHLYLTLIILAILSDTIEAQNFELIGAPGNRVNVISKNTGTTTVACNSYDGGIFISHTGGNLNIPIINPLKNFPVFDIQFVPEDDKIFFSISNKLYVSTDSGQSLQIIKDNISPNYESFKINPLKSSILYALVGENEIWRSDESGENWYLLSTFGSNLKSMNISASDTSVIYCGADNSLYRSADGGINWVKFFENAGDIRQIKINPANPNSVYFLLNFRLYKSEDGGETASLLLNAGINKYVLNPKDTLTLYAVTGDPVFAPNGGIVKTTDEGNTWFPVINGIEGEYIVGNTIEIDEDNPEELYAGIGSLGVYKTTNGGAYWELTRLSNASGSSIGNLYFEDGQLSSLQFGWGILKTTDNGINWHQPQFEPPFFQNIVAGNISYNPFNKNIGYMSGRVSLYKTTDHGNSWTATYQLEGIKNVSYHPLAEGLLFATVKRDPVSSGYLYKSNDGGENWIEIMDTINIYDEFLFHPDNPDIIWAMHPFTIVKSTDRGETWSEKINGIVPFNWITSIKQRSADTLYVTQSGSSDHLGNIVKGSIHFSTDGGESWRAIDSAWKSLDTHAAASSILLDDRNPARIYAGSYSRGTPLTDNYSNGGLFLSDNHGVNWKKIYDGSVESIISDDLVPRTIYFTTQYGIMKFLDTLTVTGINDDDFLTSRPDKYFLEQNYPNPFNPSTQINYSLKEDVYWFIRKWKTDKLS